MSIAHPTNCLLIYLEERFTNKIKTLSLTALEELAISLLEFKDISELDAWLGYPE